MPDAAGSTTRPVRNSLFTRRGGNQMALTTETAVISAAGTGTEEALREEIAFREGIIESASDGICVCHDIESHPFVHFTVWSRRMRVITGCGLAQINERGWYQSLYPDPETRERAQLRMEQMRLGNPLREEEWEITRADGTRRLVAISTSVIGSRRGATHVLAVVHDLTERRRAEEDLRHTLQELEARTHQMERSNRELSEANTALNVLLRKRDEDREELRHSILSNVRHLLLSLPRQTEEHGRHAGTAHVLL
jgi:PAS domain S-box-containing protein